VRQPEDVIYVSDAESGLEAVIVIDSTVLGPAAGGIRTARYAGLAAAQRDAESLARAMTFKCALAGLDAGGAKCVVLEHPGLDRQLAFRALGKTIEEQGGRFRTAGDLGTTDADLTELASVTRYVHTETGPLADAVAESHLVCLESALGQRVAGIRIAVQGVGSIGAAICRRLKSEGAELLIADIDEARAATIADELGAELCDTAELLRADVDVLAPCARGGVIDVELATEVRARIICGGANNIARDRKTELRLAQRGVLLVPDLLSSAGAVIAGIGRSVMGLSDTHGLISNLGRTLDRILTESAEAGRLPSSAARARARKRLASPESDNL